MYYNNASRHQWKGPGASQWRGSILHPSRPFPAQVAGLSLSFIFVYRFPSFNLNTSFAPSSPPWRSTTTSISMPSLTSLGISFIQLIVQMLTQANQLTRSPTRNPAVSAGEVLSTMVILAKGVRQSMLWAIFGSAIGYYFLEGTWVNYCVFLDQGVGLISYYSGSMSGYVACRLARWDQICFMRTTWSLLSQALVRLRLRQLATQPKSRSARGKPSRSTRPLLQFLVLSMAWISAYREASLAQSWSFCSMSLLSYSCIDILQKSTKLLPSLPSLPFLPYNHYHPARPPRYQSAQDTTNRTYSTITHSVSLSNTQSGAKMRVLLVSTICPFMIISSRIQCAFSILFMMSNSHTFSKYLSIVSTRLWINSKYAIQFSSSRSTPRIKYSEAQRRQMTLQPRYSMKEQRVQLRDRHLRTSSPQRVVRYFTVIQLQYLARRVWPCLLTISRNLIIGLKGNNYKVEAGRGLDLNIIWVIGLLIVADVSVRQDRKFIVADSEGRREAHKGVEAMQQQPQSTTNVYYNINHPTNKIQCDACKKDISKHTKILAPHHDYCVGCFCNLETLPEYYHVINKLDFPLFDVEWTADEELLMFEGLEKHGFGNWSEIAEFMGTNKSREEVEHHYTTVYLESPNFIPDNREILSKRDPETKKLNKESTNRILKRKQRQQTSNSKNQRGYLTVGNQSSTSAKTGTNPAEIIGYMPKRGDFEVQYDNEAELLLAQMQFNQDDTEEEKEMKFNLINIYNHKLTERIRRKQFVISRNLLDLKEQARIEKMRSKEEKQIYNIMRVFSRFSSAEEHEQLVQGIIREKQIRQRIEELKQFKKKGLKTLAQVERELELKRKVYQKFKRKSEQMGQISNYDPNKTRRNTKTQGMDRTEKRSSYMSREQDDLCKKLNISSRNYIAIKQKIIRQCIKQGILEKDSVSKLFKVDRTTIDSIFDFLVVKEEILGK